MRIDEIAVYHVAMPLKSPWRTAYGTEQQKEGGKGGKKFALIDSPPSLHQAMIT